MNIISDTISNQMISGANGLAIPGNIHRKAWYVQNLATGNAPLYISFNSFAGTGNFSYILKPQSSLSGYDGGFIYDSIPKWVGSIYVSGQNTSYISWQLT